jgi:hypothetical protein
VTKYKTIRVHAKPYEDHDDCLQAAAYDVAAERGLEGWDLNPRWEDGDVGEREYILLDVPADYEVAS